MFKLQKYSLRIIFSKRKRESCKEIFKSNNLLTFPSSYIYETLQFVKNNLTYFELEENYNNYKLRPKNYLRIPKHNTTVFKKQILYSGIKLYNNLPQEIQNETNLKKF